MAPIVNKTKSKSGQIGKFSSGKSTTLGGKPTNKYFSSNVSAYNNPKLIGKTTRNSMGAVGLPGGEKMATSKPIPSTSKSHSQSLNITSDRKLKIGILWIPTRKRNKNKDTAYNFYKDPYDERTNSFRSFVSGDSQQNQVIVKKEEENAPLLSDNTKPQVVSTSTSVGEDTADIPRGMEPRNYENDLYPSYQVMMDPIKEHHNNDDNDDKEYLENKKDKEPQNKFEKKKFDEDLDDVHKTPLPLKQESSNLSSDNGQDDCVITCLYYTMQCCDCVLM